jgi:hypothetical protein
MEENAKMKIYRSAAEGRRKIPVDIPARFAVNIRVSAKISPGPPNEMEVAYETGSVVSCSCIRGDDGYS